ncbi:MAG: tetratricopeptide repeat protein [Candidatus Omnitrophota bacterium]
MKNNFFNIIVLSLIFSLAISANAQAQKKSYEELQGEYEALLADRDNLLTQTKKLQQERGKYLDLERTIKQLQADKEQLAREIEGRVSQIRMLQEEMEELKHSQAPLIEERDSLKNSLEKLKIEYKILPETRRQITDLKKENSGLLRDYKLLENRIKRLEEEKLDARAQAEIYRRQLNEVKNQYEKALANNRLLEKKIAQIPEKFAELARENKVLIKQTALMHYNLGVFYTENKQYSRAIAEFEKAIELNPEDPYFHYNLGYIYAEYMVDRPKAIEHFRHFLRLTKNEDKDVDWVKKYILTWQTWEGKRPIK